MRSSPLFVALAVALQAHNANAQQPKIVSASPAFWSVGVSPMAQKDISLTFDKPMRSGFSSWSGRNSITPELDAAAIVSEDRRIYALPVRLQPGKVYVFGLNEKGTRGIGFQDDKGATLPPNYLVFQTAGHPAPDDLPPRPVSTMPPANGQQIDPTRLKSISIAFDKPMDPKKHGLQLVENGKPVDLATARFQYSPDGQTFGLAYEFKPSSNYEVTLNSTQNIGFATTTRIPLWPVRFSFTTGQPQ